MYKTVLLPVSGKHGLVRAQTALRHAAALVSGEIVLLHVCDPVPLTVGGQAHADLKAEQVAKGETLLGAVGAELKNRGIAYRCRIEEGTTAETIIRVGHEENADMIVMLTDGRNGLPDFLLGSITERVLRGTDTSLLAVRQPQTA